MPIAPRTTSEPGSPNSKNHVRLLLVLGAALIGGGLWFRSSAWSKERYLRTLSVEELALEVHDAPRDALTWSYFASEMMKAKDPAAAERAFRHATECDPKMYRAQLGLGSARLQQGKLKEAVAPFEAASKLNPKSADAFVGLAQIYYRAGSSQRAIPNLLKVVELQPANGIAWYTLGVMYGNNREWAKAYEAIGKAVKIDDKQSDYWRELGDISFRYNRLDDAEREYKKAIELRPKEATAYYLLGQVYTRKGNDAKTRGEAETVLLHAISRDPTLAAPHFLLGDHYERGGNLALAESNFRRAFELDNTDPRTLNRLGLLLVRRGQSAEGKKLLKGSQELTRVRTDTANLENRLIGEPKNRDLRLRLARLYRQYGNLVGAMRVYRDYEALGPVSAEIRAEMDAVRKEAAGSPAGLPPGHEHQPPPGLLGASG